MSFRALGVLSLKLLLWELFFGFAEYIIELLSEGGAFLAVALYFSIYSSQYHCS